MERLCLPILLDWEGRLRKALAELGLWETAIMIPRAFELNPNAPEKTKDKGVDTISKRFGMSSSQTRCEFAKIAQEDGLVLNQENTWHTNTFNAHRLMKLGLATNDRHLSERLNELLFQVFFVTNQNLADPTVFLQTGIAAGLDEKAVRELLNSDEYERKVRADEAKAARLSIHAVPYFIFEHGATGVGALSVGEFKNILQYAVQNSQSAQCGPDGCVIK